MQKGVAALSVKDYARSAAFDFLLCFVISCAMGFITCGAFFVSPDLQYSPFALVAGAAIPLAMLFAAAYSKRTIVVGGIAIVAVLGVACLVASGVSGASWMFDEVESNPTPFILIMFICSLSTFLCTRKRWMSRVYLVVAAFEMCFVEFLYRWGYWPALLVALVALGAMVVYRNYHANLRDASTDRVSFTSAFGAGMGYSLVLAGIASMLFFLIVAPLNPGAIEFKPFTRYMNYETIEMTGIGDATATPDQDNRTNQTNDVIEETNDLDDSNGESSQGDESNMSPEDNPFIGTLQDLANSTIKSLQELVNFLIENPPLGLLVLVLLLIVLSSPYWIKKLLRRRWYVKTSALPPLERIEGLYAFFMRRFELLGIKPAPGMTLAEFAESNKGAMAPFGGNPLNATFADLTDVHSRCVYGGCEPTEDEVGKFDAFYKGFYRSFVRACGRAKYVLKFRFFRV